MQAKQFEQLKRAAKKEKIEINVDDIPEILRLIKDFQQGAKFNSKSTKGDLPDESSLATSDTYEHFIATSPDELPTFESLKMIASVK